MYKRLHIIYKMDPYKHILKKLSVPRTMARPHNNSNVFWWILYQNIKSIHRKATLWSIQVTFAIFFIIDCTERRHLFFFSVAALEILLATWVNEIFVVNLWYQGSLRCSVLMHESSLKLISDVSSFVRMIWLVNHIVDTRRFHEASIHPRKPQRRNGFMQIF